MSWSISTALKHIPCYLNISGFRLSRDVYRQYLLGNETSNGSFPGIIVQFLLIVASNGK